MSSANAIQGDSNSLTQTHKDTQMYKAPVREIIAAEWGLSDSSCLFMA